jgi:hypothetical protein
VVAKEEASQKDIDYQTCQSGSEQGVRI